MHNKKSRRIRNKQHLPIEYVWTLYKFIGFREEREIGRYLFPVSDIENGLTANFILKELNNRNCFDFEYTPNEGDNLIINQVNSHVRIEFIFRSGKWVEEYYSPFEHEYGKVENGIIKSFKTD